MTRFLTVTDLSGPLTNVTYFCGVRFYELAVTCYLIYGA